MYNHLVKIGDLVNSGMRSGARQIHVLAVKVSNGVMALSKFKYRLSAVVLASLFM